MRLPTSSELSAARDTMFFPVVLLLWMLNGAGLLALCLFALVALLSVGTMPLPIYFWGILALALGGKIFNLCKRWLSDDMGNEMFAWYLLHSGVIVGSMLLVLWISF